MNENELYVVKDYKFDNPLITKIDSIINIWYRGCHYKNFHNFEYECIYDIKLTKITNDEIINLPFSGKSMNLYELNEKLTVARQNGFVFDETNKLTKKFYSYLRYINISYYLKLQIPKIHRKFFKLISQNHDYVDNFCNDMENPFHFACQKCINQLN